MKLPGKNHNAHSIGIIGGADGPTAILVSTKSKKSRLRDRMNRLLEKRGPMAAHTSLEVEAYFIQTHGATPVIRETRGNGHERALVGKLYADRLPKLPGPDAPREAYEAYARESNRAMEALIQELGPFAFTAYEVCGPSKQGATCRVLVVFEHRHDYVDISLLCENPDGHRLPRRPGKREYEIWLDLLHFKGEPI